MFYLNSKASSYQRNSTMTRSFTNTSFKSKTSQKIQDTSIAKDIVKNDYYIQISPRLETQSLTFTNSVKQIKIIQQSSSITEIQAPSSRSSNQKVKNLVQKMHSLVPKKLPTEVFLLPKGQHLLTQLKKKKQ